MKRTIKIEIDDTLDERCQDALDEIMERAKEYQLENEEETLPDWETLDYDGTCHGIIDSTVPIYTAEIKALWYLYGNEFEEAYENAGIGSNPMENDGMVAIYCYIDEFVRGAYQTARNAV